MKLRIGIPKGSLQEATLRAIRACGSTAHNGWPVVFRPNFTIQRSIAC